jgi:S1-C subfamily serine protease
MRIRLLLIGVFVMGLLTGAAAIVFWVVLPREGTIIAVTAPTPSLPDDTVYAQLNALDQVFSSVYDRVSPSVVHISSQQEAFNPFYGIVPQEGTGSGFVYDGDGHIVTNNHVIAGATQVEALLANGVALPAEVIGTDSYYDLAVLRIQVEPGVIYPLELAESSALKVGQTVIAIGNPFGLDRTLTTGVISALGRRIETHEGAIIGQAIQTDAAINPGNSGGPLLDVYGRVVGINTAINSPSGGSVGIGFAVPSDIVKRVVPALIEDGRYAHPSLLIQVAELGTEVRLTQNTHQRGLLIIDIAANSGAQRAGLRAASVTIQRGQYVISGGDIITAIDGRLVETRNDMLLILEENYRPGDPVTLSILREGQPMKLEVILDAE